ncbi:hypothetical protein [Pseudomonas sp. QD4]|uniref:hypothetical protein n=1 Tax=Pseudomonas sp. QD4 TaxID=3368618 RepID=UPI003BA0E910
MSIVPIDVGQEPNDETGDTLRDGGIRINANFAELDTRTAAAQAKAEQGVADAAAAKAKADAAVPGAAVGVSVAQLINGAVPASQLPSFVDDVLEFPVRADFPAIGETGKIYIAINDGDSPTNPTRQYRWSGAAYVLIPSSPGSTDQVPEGSTNQYFTVARVRSTTLSGLGALVNAAILASDTVLQAFAKLQGQLNAKLGKSEAATDSDKLGGQPPTFYTSTMVGATASTAGVKGLVPASVAGDQAKFLRADGAWGALTGQADLQAALAAKADTANLVFSKKWTSSPITPTFGATTLLTHNFGLEVKASKVTLTLSTAFGGYAAGEKIILPASADYYGTANTGFGCQIVKSTASQAMFIVANAGIALLTTVGGPLSISASTGTLTVELYA